MVTAVFSNHTSCIRLNDSVWDMFKYNDGFPQDDSIPTLVFSIYINNLSQTLAHIKTSITIDIIHYTAMLQLLL